MMTFTANDPREHEFVFERPVVLTDGLASCDSAFLEVSPKCNGWFVLALADYQQRGLVKIKTARVVKRLDWIKP